MRYPDIFRAFLVAIILLSGPIVTKTTNACVQGAQKGDVQEWTQWRGPNRDGLVENPNWPDDLKEGTLVKKWSVPMGPSYSGPIVVGDKVFVTETKDRKDEVVYALNRENGAKIWETDWKGSIQVPFFAKANGDWIRSTPTYDDGRLYVGGIRDLFVCLDAGSGEEIWKLDFAKEFGSAVPSFGCVCSPLIDGEYLYVQAGGGFCKLEKSTGKVLWRVLVDGGGMNGSTFSSPYIGTLGGKRQVIVQMREKLHGIELESGRTLWSQVVKTFRGMNILTPSVYKNGIFLSTYGGTTQMISVATSGPTFTPKKLWETNGQGYMSSPVIVGEHAYLNMKNKTIACFNLESGKLCWSSPRYGQYASLVSNGEKVLALDQTGKLILFRANSEKYEMLDSRKVSNDSWAHLAIRGNEIFVRELDKITAYRWESSQK